MIKKTENFESCLIPAEFDYDQILSFSTESREKFKKHLPRSLGQASRIDGVRSSDLSILMVYMEKNRKTHKSLSKTKLRKRGNARMRKREKQKSQ